jgi:hypothetical protein
VEGPDGAVEIRSMAYTEYYRKGTEPDAVCDEHEGPGFLERLAGVFGKDTDLKPVSAEAAGLPSVAIPRDVPTPPVTITTSDGTAPTITNVTVAGVDDALNGSGPAGGSLQLPPTGWTIDLTYLDNGTIDTARTRISANVTIGTASGSQPAGTDLRPFLTTITANSTTASYRVPTSMTFPSGPLMLDCLVVDAGGLGSAPSSFACTVRAFADSLRPFETRVNPAQVWFLDFSRDVEALNTSTIPGGVSVDVTASANSRADFEDVLRVLGLDSPTPIANTVGNADSNAVVATRFKNTLLQQLAALYAGTNILWRSTDRGDTWTALGDRTTGIDRRTLPIMGALPTARTLSLDDGTPYWPSVSAIPSNRLSIPLCT